MVLQDSSVSQSTDDGSQSSEVECLFVPGEQLLRVGVACKEER